MKMGLQREVSLASCESDKRKFKADFSVIQSLDKRFNTIPASLDVADRGARTIALFAYLSCGPSVQSTRKRSFAPEQRAT